MKKTFGNISTDTSALNACKSTDLVIEAIVENLAIKQKLFKELDKVASKFVNASNIYLNSRFRKI